MLDDDKTASEDVNQTTGTAAANTESSDTAADKAPARKTAAKKTTKKAASAKTASEKAGAEKSASEKTGAEKSASEKTGAAKAAAKKTAARKTAAKKTARKSPAKKAGATKADPELPLEDAAPAGPEADENAPAEPPAGAAAADSGAGETEEPGAGAPPVALLFQPPEVPAQPRRARKAAAVDVGEPDEAEAGAEPDERAGDVSADTEDADETGETDETGDGEQGARRRRRRGGRRRRKSGEGSSDDDSADSDDRESADTTDGSDRSGESSGERADDEPGEGSGTRRRRRRRRDGDRSTDSSDDPDKTVTRVRKARSVEDEITAVAGSTRLEAKKQRRREGREAGRRRAPIVSEAEFLARREAVDRAMVIRQREDLTQIAVLEDKVLVEHYVARESQTSLIGNVYVGRVQNVLPSMEAAFIDIGKGRNAVLYAGEVNWSALGHKEGQPRKIESVLSSGQSILVQVTKDPVGHKGARLTSQISLAGRFLVYVPDGTTSGISRKLPDTERTRLKTLLKEIVPDTAGVIVRTAAEGASEDELTRDVERLKARWEDIESKSKSGGAPKLLYGEPDLTLKVVRDLFTEDFSRLVIQGDDAWDTVQNYVSHVAPDLEGRLEQHDPGEAGDVFATYRIDEQIAKGLDRKVWLPSGGSLIIDRTEAMTVVDVNTGKFTGSGGNLEETVTKNNLEAAEEIVRQLRLRDIGGIIVVDFIDMVLESNRDLVLRRLVECLGRDRTRHQVAEVTSLGLVQMTRKRIGTGLLEAFSEACEHCQGRGVVVHDMPVEPRKGDDEGRRGGRRGRGRSGGGGGNGGAKPAVPSPKDIAAVAKPENADRAPLDEGGPEAEVKPGRKTEPKKAPEPAAPEPALAVPEEPAQEQEPAASTEPAAPVAPAEPEAPKVVTRHRRVARRAAGSTGTSAPAPVVLAPATAESDGEPAPVAPPAAEPPKVVTRKRRAASRPAGAAAEAVSVDGSGPADTQSDGGPTADDEVPAAELHVPIKKKGSRKR